MVISQPISGNNPSYYRASPTLPQLLWMLPETPYVLYMQLQHQGNSQKWCYCHTFTRIRSTEGSSADCSLFILSLHALALHLAVKILLQIFLYEDLISLALYIHLSVVFPSRMPAGPHFVTQPILLSETFLIFDINHQQNTRRSDQIETIKTIMQTTRLVSHGRFYQWLRVAIFKEIFDQVCEKI